MRLPQPLKLPDNSACASAVLANILYMFERTSTPDIAAADRMLQRRPGRAAQFRIEVPCLLHGLTVRVIRPYDPARFLDEDADYWRRMRRRSSDWTPKTIAQFLAREAEMQKQLARFKGHRYKLIPDRPNAKELHKAVFALKTVAKISLRRSARVRHAVLLHALHNDGQCWVFDAARKPQEQPLSPRELKKWDTEGGMTVVSSP